MIYDEAVDTSRAPLQATPRDRELVRFATLAANGHNTQPWIFSARGNEIAITPDFTHRCPAALRPIIAAAPAGAGDAS